MQDMHLYHHAMKTSLSPIFGISLMSLALAVSASTLAQTPTDATGKKVPAVQTAESQAALTPTSALEKLKKGNARFVEKNMRTRDWMAKVPATASGQHPFAAILACMDSRNPIEIIFDQESATSSGFASRATSLTTTNSAAWNTQRRSSE